MKPNPTRKVARIVRCPTCHKTARYDEANESRPFCSERCKTQDTASWADESFRIPGPAAGTPDDPDPEDPQS